MCFFDITVCYEGKGKGQTKQPTGLSIKDADELSSRLFKYNTLFKFSYFSAQVHEESPSEYEVHLTCAFGENIKENIKPFKITDDQSGIL